MEITVAQQRSTESGIELTLEQVLYVGLFAVALFFRLWNLGTVPLDATESGTALQSWSMYKTLPTTLQGSPLLIYLNSLIFFLFGASDAAARTLPALAGSLLVILPYAFRRQIGRTAALSAAILLTFSPVLVFFSRYAGEAMFAAAISLALVATFTFYVQSRKTSTTDLPLYLTAILLGLLLASGLPGYINVLVFAAFLLGFVLMQKRAQGGELGLVEELGQSLSVEDVWPGSQKARNWAIVFAITLVVVLTGGLTNLHGIQEGTINTLALGFQESRGEIVFPSYLLLLLIYETLVVLFAAINVFNPKSRPTTFHWFLIWWAAATLVIISFLPQKQAAMVVQPLVPIVLLAASPIGALVQWALEKKPGLSLSVLAIISLPPLLLAVYVLSRYSLPGESIPWLIAAIPVFMLVLAFVGSLYWRGFARMAPLWGILCLVGLFALMLHVTTNLNFQQEMNASELLRGRVAVADVRNLTSDLDQVLSARAGEEPTSEVIIEESQKALLGWHLRKYNPKFSTTNNNPLVIIGRDDTELPLGEWATQRYSISVSAPRSVGSNLAQFWRWIIYREVPSSNKYDNVVLYILF